MLCWLAGWLALSVPWPSTPSAPPRAPQAPAVQRCSMWALRAPSDRVKLFLLSGGQGPSVSTSALNRAHRSPPSLPNQSWNSALSPSLRWPQPKQTWYLARSLFFLSPSPGTLSFPSSKSLIRLGRLDVQNKINYIQQPPLRSPNFCSNPLFDTSPPPSSST